MFLLHRPAPLLFWLWWSLLPQNSPYLHIVKDGCHGQDQQCEEGRGVADNDQSPNHTEDQVQRPLHGVGKVAVHCVQVLHTNKPAATWTSLGEWMALSNGYITCLHSVKMNAPLREGLYPSVSNLYWRTQSREKKPTMKWRQHQCFQQRHAESLSVLVIFAHNEVLTDENLLTMRPTGVVSKKVIGACRTRDSILWCNTLAVKTVRNSFIILKAIVVTAATKKDMNAVSCQ